MYKYNNVECVNYIPTLHNNVERYNINSDDDNIDNINKKDKNSKRIEDVLINNITKHINKIESIALNKSNSLLLNRNSKKEGINTYKISNPQLDNIKVNKKYIGLIFVNNEKKSSFITLSKNVYIINYYITVMVNDINEKNNNYFCSLGIKNSDVNKISIIKGSKNYINIKNNLHSELIIIKDTIIYEAPVNQEICLITDFNKKCNIVEDKSIIKIIAL
jgi:hypothetical protein